MHPTTVLPTNARTVYQIVGFDRMNFVGDVADAVPQHEHCRITGLTFEGDGTRVNGQLIVQVQDARHLSTIDRQLQAIRGLVSIKKTVNQLINSTIICTYPTTFPRSFSRR